jgi:hypothetical protein
MEAGIMTNGGSATWILVGIGVVLLALLLLSGSNSEPATQTTVDPEASTTIQGSQTVATTGSTSVPVVHAGLDRTVGERETIQLLGEGYDPSGLPVTYLWTMEGGLGVFADARSPITTFITPSACDCDDCVILTLTVTNSAGRSASDQMVVTISDPIACPTQTYESSGAYALQLCDPCEVDDSATCPATPSEPCTSPCITEVTVDLDCPIAPVACPCAENGDCTQEWQTGWPFDDETTLPKDRAKPSIDRQFPSVMAENGTVVLHGYIRNPACQTVCYTWSASKGWFENANTLTPTYHAPASDRRDGETVTITLTVYDTSEGRSYDQIRIKIQNTG